MHQPKTLYILSFAEIWDRFNYYGLQAVLILYLLKQFSFTDSRAIGIYAVYTTLAFFMPIIGGFVADKLHATKSITLLGITCMFIGDGLMLSPSLSCVYLGLTSLIIGIGFFKPNNFTLLGHLYPTSDERKNTGFTIYYLSMNLGAILGPLTYGFLAAYLHWQLGFIINLVTLIITGYVLFRSKEVRDQQAIPAKMWLLILVGIIVACGIIWTIFYDEVIFTVVVCLAVAAVIAGITWTISRQTPAVTKQLMTMLLLFSLAIGYFVANVQVGSSLLLYVDSCVNTTVLGFHFPAATFPSLEPLWVLLLAPLVTIYWNRRALQPFDMTIHRCADGLLFGGISFFIFALSTWLPDSGFNYRLLAVLIGNIFLGAGEITLAPPIFAAVSLLAPRQLQGTFMGILFLLVAFSSYIGSWLAKLGVSSEAKETVVQAHGFAGSFLLTALIGFAGFTLLLVLKRRLLRTVIV